MEGSFNTNNISSAHLNTEMIECLHIDSAGGTSIISIARKLNRTLQHAAQIITIPALTLAIIIGIYQSILTPSFELVLRAGLSVSGLVFIALAVDSTKASTGWLLAATGVALPVLSYLSIGGNPVFTILAILLVALWVTTSIQRG